MYRIVVRGGVLFGTHHLYVKRSSRWISDLRPFTRLNPSGSLLLYTSCAGEHAFPGASLVKIGADQVIGPVAVNISPISGQQKIVAGSLRVTIRLL